MVPALIVALLIAVAAWVVTTREREPNSVEIVAETGIQALDTSGKTIWRKEFNTTVALFRVTSADDDEMRIAVGLGGYNAGAGDLVMLDARGGELWRFHPGRTSPYTENRQLHYAVRWVLIDDVLPESPGKELVVCWVCQWHPSVACILSQDGKLLRKLWHHGALGGVLRLGDTRKLIFWGCNNALRDTPLGDGSREIYYSFFCIEADRVSGQCPPYFAPNVPRAPILWYKAIKPQGVGYQRVTDKVRFGPPKAQIEVWTTDGWILYLDANGSIVHKEAGERAGDVAPELIDGLTPFAADGPPAAGSAATAQEHETSAQKGQ